MRRKVVKDENLVKRLKNRFDYDPETGIIQFRVGSEGGRWGKEAGAINHEGRRTIGFEGDLLPATHIVWAIHTGAWPTEIIHTLNNNPRDLRIANLQMARKKGKDEKLTQQLVRELFDYDPETGHLFYRTGARGRSIPTGVPIIYAETRAQKDYNRVSVNGKMHFQHRIIWLWYYGYLPENRIDHIDQNSRNNAISNLREVSPQCNSRNCKVSKNNKSGINGITINKSGKFIASIKVNYTRVYLGTYSDEVEAVAHRLAAEECIDWAGCHSSSSAYVYMQKYLAG